MVDIEANMIYFHSEKHSFLKISDVMLMSKGRYPRRGGWYSPYELTGLCRWVFQNRPYVGFSHPENDTLRGIYRLKLIS